MFELIYQIIWISCMSVLFVNAEPMILIKRWMGLKEEEMGKNPLRDFFTKLLYCVQCSSFWIAWIFTQNFQLACTISIVATIIDNFTRGGRL